MNLRELGMAIGQWGPFALRTAGYGTVSCLLGPLTRDRRASLWAMRRWCQSSVRALDIVVECSGIEHVPTSEPFVYCSNHQSLVDIIVLGAVLPGDYKWAAKRSLLNIPFLGWHLRLAGHVPVDRKPGSSAANETIDRFVGVLRGGKPLLVFPEGTRTLDGELRTFKKGAFQAAVRSGSPIVPVALDGTHGMMSKGESNTGQGTKTVLVKIGAPIDLPKGGNEADRIDVLRERTRAELGDLFESIRRS